ncbi:hypothetical protein JCM33374_g6162 [Metschnikowia sp. JCM 33374]|nr:hypothetical protein JCM33374_g6162 [Metschnikowia sp. JCM 33374]
MTIQDTRCAPNDPLRQPARRAGADVRVGKPVYREQYERRFGPMGINSNDDDGHDHGATMTPTPNRQTQSRLRSSAKPPKKAKYYGPLSSNNMTEDYTISSNNASNKSSPSRGLSTIHGRSLSKSPTATMIPMRRRNSCATSSTQKPMIISYPRAVLRFIDEYASVPEMTGKAPTTFFYYMILILSVQRLNPTKYNDICKRRVSNFQQMWKAVKSLKNCFSVAFSKPQPRQRILRHRSGIHPSRVGIHRAATRSWVHDVSLFHRIRARPPRGYKASSSFFENMADDANHPSGSGNGSSNSKDGYEDYFVDELPKLRTWWFFTSTGQALGTVLGPAASNKDALNYIMGSILLFYDTRASLYSNLSEIPQILESNEAKEGEIRLDKVFIFRILSFFVYLPGIVVTFILVSIKANDFIRDNNGDFITQVEGQLHMLLGLHSSISKLCKGKHSSLVTEQYFLDEKDPPSSASWKRSKTSLVAKRTYRSMDSTTTPGGRDAWK